MPSPCACAACFLAGKGNGYLGTLARTLRLIDFHSAWREVPAHAVYRVPLAMNPEAEAVSLRPVLFLLKTLGWSRP
ncbi:hypothetical protein [Caballeronia sp. RCC_10]|uniref:hypothetical protein n=1 Tax=Caballeronia sp. RCC_10 TaxID=3239227 RepID=UPI00352406BF